MPNPTYSPKIIVYYGQKGSNDHRLTPAPDFTVSLEYQYSNDTIIGYTYIFNFTGNATSLDLSDVNYGEEYDPNSLDLGIGATIEHINKLRKILSQNGNILYVVNAETNTEILRAKGGILRSFNIDESSNNWVHYAPYTASIEFNTVDFMSNDDGACSTFLDPDTYASTDNGIVNINKFKLKSFTDSWSFTFDETESFARESILNFNNTSFSIEYTISATGKNFYDYDDPSSSVSSKMLPAWEQAKNFVQYRLHSQVTNLLNSVLKNTYTSSCADGDKLSDLHIPGSSSKGLLKTLGDANYGVYNEIITCELSESDGTYSATYTAIVKNKNTNLNYGSHDTKHSLTKSEAVDRSSLLPIKTISIEGTIEGLVEGGLIRNATSISLPSQGRLFLGNNSGYNRYANAKQVLDKLLYTGSAVGVSGKRDLSSAFKNDLKITIDSLGISPDADDPVPERPYPNSFNITHDYLNGTINYTAEYSSKNFCGRKYRDISIETSMPTKVIALFNIPNSNSCPLIQDLGTQTAKTVSLTVQGLDLTDGGQPPEISFNDIIKCNGCFSMDDLPITIPQGAIITDQTYTKNPLDGSFTVNVSYICTTGCDI